MLLLLDRFLIHSPLGVSFFILLGYPFSFCGAFFFILVGCPFSFCRGILLHFGGVSFCSFSILFNVASCIYSHRPASALAFSSPPRKASRLDINPSATSTTDEVCGRPRLNGYAATYHRLISEDDEDSSNGDSDSSSSQPARQLAAARELVSARSPATSTRRSSPPARNGHHSEHV